MSEEVRLNSHQRRLWNLVIVFGMVTPIGIVLGTGILTALHLDIWAWSIGGGLMLLTIATVAVILRSLSHTGPPFDRLRWWWPFGRGAPSDGAPGKYR